MSATPVETRPAAGAQTLERGLLVLVALADHPGGLTTSEAARVVRVHRSVAHRLLTTLVGTGFAERDDSGRYRVGSGLLSVADRSRPRLREAAEPVLTRLAAELGATACLVEVAGDAAVATVVVEPPIDGPRLSYRVGNRDPLDQGAGGLAALASKPAMTGEPERVSEVRRAGYACTSGEVMPGSYGVAAPVHCRRTVTPASVTVITHRRDLVEPAISLVVAAAAEISTLLEG